MSCTAPAPHRRFVCALALAAAGAAIALPAAPARAQVIRMSVSSGGPIGLSSRPAMSTKELDAYAGLLGFDDAQKEAAKELLTTYTAEFEQASKEHRDKVRAIADEFNETRDDEVWQKMGPLNEKFSKRSDELETSLLSDIKSLCSEKQLALWPKMERTRRRDRTIERGSVSGESVDLVRILRDLELSDPIRNSLAEQLDAYEQDLDRTLIARNKVMDEQTATLKLGQGPMNFDMEKMQKQMKEIREAGEKVRDVNQRYTRAFASILPDDVRPTFELAVKRASFPMVYKESKTQHAIDAALKFDDLDAKQRESVQALRVSYEQQLQTLNDKWADAIVEEEKDSTGFGFGGGMVVLSMGDDEQKPSAEARKARREADKKALESLQALLTDPQKDRLPKESEERAAEGTQMIISR